MMRFTAALFCAVWMTFVAGDAAAQRFLPTPLTPVSQTTPFETAPSMLVPSAAVQDAYPNTSQYAYPNTSQYAYPKMSQFALPGTPRFAYPRPQYADPQFIAPYGSAPLKSSTTGGDRADRLENYIDALGPSGYDTALSVGPHPSPSDAGNYNPWNSTSAGSCEACASDCDTCARGCWYGSIAGMIMTRDRPDPVWLTYPGAAPTSVLMGSSDASIDWTGGWQFILGRRLDESHRVEIVYWGLDPVVYNDSARDAATNNLSSPLDFGVLAAGGTQLGTLFDTAREHRFRRENEIHNIELNVIHESPMSCCGFDLEWTLGTRYFRFDENWDFSSVNAGFDFGDSAVQEGRYNIDMENSMIGLQFGTLAHWQLGQRWGLRAGQKVGIYANNVKHRSQGTRGDGASAFNIASSKNEVSFLAEIDLGLDYTISSRWGAFVTYRAVAVSNVALADDQVPQFISDAAGIAAIDTNGHLILHGLLIGAEYNY